MILRAIEAGLIDYLREVLHPDIRVIRQGPGVIWVWDRRTQGRCDILLHRSYLQVLWDRGMVNRRQRLELQYEHPALLQQLAAAARLISGPDSSADAE